ncbi:MAG: DUF4886 domain-containing protein [Opitutaceae bacterium]|jgi:hypothetical protein
MRQTTPSVRPSFLRRNAPAFTFLLLAITLCIPPQVRAATAAERTSVKVLTIGNSFVDYPVALLPDLAKAGGKTLVLGKANLGGCSLERHAKHLAQAEANDPAGRVYKAFVDPKTKETRAVTLPEALAADKWEIVTIQQWSQQSYKPETFHPYVDQLIAAVRKYAPTAEIIIQETWAYREDHPFFHKDDGFTQKKMHEGLRATYHQLAADTGFRVMPTGDAIELARQTPRWTFVADKNFDFKNPPAGQVPNEPTSLHSGWAWKKNKAGESKLTLDAIHLSNAGKYLAAAVWYQFIFNADSVPAGFAPPGISAEDAADLRQHANAAIQAERTREAAPVAK